MTDDDFSRAVGYRKPPRKHQFKKGQTGNPRGRPKKKFQDIQNIVSIYLKVLGTHVEIKVNGKLKKVTYLEAMVIKQALKGMEGGFKPAKHFFDVMSDLIYQKEEFLAQVKWLRILNEEHGLDIDKTESQVLEKETKN